MSSQNLCSQIVEPRGRPVGGTEKSLCRAAPGGTGIIVVAILTSQAPEASSFENALQRLQMSHPILRSRLHSDTSKNTFAFVTAPVPIVTVKTFDLPSTLDIIEKSLSNPQNQPISPFHLILEHELNQNAWRGPNDSKCVDDIQDMFFATGYTLPDSKWAGVLRLHASACDRTTAVSLLKELVVLLATKEGGCAHREIGDEAEVALGVEDLIPKGKAKKAFWSRGLDMLSYSMNSLRLTNLKFMDAKSPRCSQSVRLQLSQHCTEKLIAGCRAKGIKLSGLLASAGMMAAHSSKSRAGKQTTYGVVTLVDCRSILEPALSDDHFGFYHSAILNTHVMGGGENLWELAQKVYKTFSSHKNSNKHFSDMADFNFLMCKAIENPSLTPSSALRSSLLSVFEDTVIYNTGDREKEIGLEDYVVSASVHGLGPSIAILDTIRDGRLDCVCAYPSPLHSREQMSKFIENMKRILVDA